MTPELSSDSENPDEPIFLMYASLKIPVGILLMGYEYGVIIIVISIPMGY